MKPPHPSFSPLEFRTSNFIRHSNFVLRHSLCLLALLLSACTVDPGREVALYREVLAPGEAAPIVPQDPDAWLPASAPALPADATLTLAQALRYANDDNERLASAGERYVQALIEKDRRFAEFLPTLDFAPRLAWNETFHTPPGMDASMFPRHALDAPLNARMNLFNGFRDVARSSAAGYSAEAEKHRLLDMQETILMETAATYYAVLKAEKAVEVLTYSATVQEARVRDIAAKAAQGMARQLDLEQSKARAAAVRVDLAEAKAMSARARATLARLIGSPSVDAQLTDALPPSDLPLELDPLFTRASAQRPDLQAADQAVLAARKEVDAAFAQYYPSVSLNLDAFVYRETFPEDSLATALIQAKIPLFSAGRIHADVRTAWSRFRQAVLARSELHRVVTEQLRQAATTLAASQEKTQHMQVQAAAAREAFRIAGQAYDQGVATNLDRLDAQDQLLNAEVRLALEQFDARVYALNLLRATGNLRSLLKE